MTRRRGGFTLLEALIASALFIVAGLITYSVFKYAMLAHSRGVLGTDAQRSVREFTTRLTGDLQGSMVLQVPSLSDQEAGSAVLCPSTSRDKVDSQIAFTAPANQQVSSLNTSDPSAYVLVRYVRTTTEKNKIYRRSYPYDAVVAQDCVTFGTDPDQTASRSCLYLKTTGAGNIDSMFGAPGGTITTATSATNLAKDTGWQEVVSLGGANDLVKFSLSHAAVTGTSTSPYYDPFHFALTVSVIRYAQTPRNVVSDIDANEAADAQNDRVRRDLTTEVTLPRFQ